MYSAAKHNPLLDLSWAWNMEIGLPRPDLVLFLTISPQIQATRGGFGEERYESDLIQTAVRGCFERLWKGYDGNVQNIDAEGTLDEVETRISGAVRLVLTSPDSSLKTLRSLRNE